MRWDALFADMEARLADADRSELALRADDLTRAERAGVRMADRLRGASGEVLVALVDGSHVRGRVIGAADGWFDLAEGLRRHVVPNGAVAWVQHLPHAAAPGGTVERRLGLGHALRALARDRVRVAVRTVAGTVTGRVARVGHDHVDLDTGSERPGGDETTILFARIVCLSEVL